MKILELFLENERSLVRRVVDTNNPPENPEDFNSFLRGAGWFEHGVITGVHVTDNPTNMINTLSQNISVSERQYGDLGNGFYFSDSPQIWMGRSRGKWDFLENLTSLERQKLAQAILNDKSMLSQHYLSTSEKETARRLLDQFVRNGDLAITELAGQPYNITFWQPEFLQKLGIQAAQQPHKIQVAVVGRFAQLEQNISDRQAAELRNHGFDGAFTQGGFSTTPQFVVWNNSAIKQFGSWSG